MLAWLIIYAVFRFAQRQLLSLQLWLGSYSMEEFRRHLHRRLIDKSQRLRLEQFERSQHYDLLQRARNVASSSVFFNLMGSLTRAASSAIAVVSLTTLLIVYDPRIVVAIALATLPVLITRLLESRREYDIHRGQAHDERLQDYLARRNLVYL